MITVKYKFLDPLARCPSKSFPTDAGFDLWATSVALSDTYIEYGTGISLEIPSGYGGFVFPRSSISHYGLTLANSVGVIDSQYRGEIKLRFYSVTAVSIVPYHIGDRIGQLVVLQLPDVDWVYSDTLSETERGTGGFGHTGN